MFQKVTSKENPGARRHKVSNSRAVMSPFKSLISNFLPRPLSDIMLPDVFCRDLTYGHLRSHFFSFSLLSWWSSCFRKKISKAFVTKYSSYKIYPFTAVTTSFLDPKETPSVCQLSTSPTLYTPATFKILINYKIETLTMEQYF